MQGQKQIGRKCFVIRGFPSSKLSLNPDPAVRPQGCKSQPLGLLEEGAAFAMGPSGAGGRAPQKAALGDKNDPGNPARLPSFGIRKFNHTS